MLIRFVSYLELQYSADLKKTAAHRNLFQLQYLSQWPVQAHIWPSEQKQESLYIWYRLK